MKRLSVILAVLSLAMFLALPLYCQQDNMKVVEGSVVSVDIQGSAIIVKAADNMAFSVAADAEITNQDGLDIELSDISSGNYVIVGYYNDKSGKRIAKSINVEYSD